MVCLRNISVDILHKGDTEDDDDDTYATLSDFVCVCVCVCVFCPVQVKPLGGSHSQSENLFHQTSANNINKPGEREVILSIDLQQLITDQITV
jgi:hypothetical protein